MEGDVALLLSWYEIRDLLTGGNSLLQDVGEALSLAKACPHPEAQWLCRVFEDEQNVTTRYEARHVFLQHDDDPRALCFGSLVLEFDDWDLERMKKSAEMGFPLAQACFGWGAPDASLELLKKFAISSSESGERDGHYLMGHLYEVRVEIWVQV